LRLLQAPGPNGHARNVADLGQRAQLHACLNARTDHGDAANFLRRQNPRDDRPGGAGPHVAEVAIVKQQSDRLAVIRVEDENQATGHGQPDLRVAVEAAHELEGEVLGAVNVGTFDVDLGVDLGDIEPDRWRYRDLTAAERLERSLDRINGGRHVDAVANFLFRHEKQ